MTGLFRHISGLFFIGFILIYGHVKAQTVELSGKEQAILQAAEDSLLTGNYAFSLEKFSSLLSLHNDEVYFRYKYALCLVEMNSQLDQAIDYLEMASAGGIRESAYYLGKAYHYRYMFDKAIGYYQRYLNSDLPDREKNLPVHRQIAMAQNGKKLVEYAYVLNILENKSLTLKDFYYSYDLDKTGGKFIKKHASLQSRIDRKREKDPIMFFSTAHDVILFSSYGKKGRTGKDIYILRRKNPGEWGEPEKLDGIINTTEDEAYPYLHPSGKQLFFCSKGHNSMGGYDIFMSEWNESTQNWGIPVNLDFPVNSPLDDILYVNDSSDNYAVFASRRDSENDRVSIYKILINKDPEKRKIENMQDLIKTSHLDVNLLTENLEQRDASTTGLPVKMTEARKKDSIRQPVPADSLSPELLTYEALKDSVKSDFDNIRQVRNKMSKDQNRMKHLTRDAWARGDTVSAMATLEAVGLYEAEISKLQSDLDAMEAAYFDLPLKENILPSEQTGSQLEAIADNTRNVLDDYQSYTPPDVMNASVQAEQKKVEILRREVDDLQVQLEENIRFADPGEFSAGDIEENEQIRKKQEGLFSDLSEKQYDLESRELSLQNKKGKLNALQNAMKDLPATPVLNVDIPEADIRLAEQKGTENRLSTLLSNKKQRDAQQKQLWEIPAWYESQSYQDRIENALISAEDQEEIPPDLMVENEALDRALQEKEESLLNIENIREQLKSASPAEKEQLWDDMHANLLQLEESQNTIQDILSRENTLAHKDGVLSETENNDSTDLMTEDLQNTDTRNRDEETNTETLVSAGQKSSGYFETEEARVEFIASGKNALSGTITEARQLTDKSDRLKEKRESLNMELSSGDIEPERVRNRREEHLNLIKDALSLNEDALKTAHDANQVLKEQILTFSEGKPQVSMQFNGRIKEAERLAEEAESFEIAASNTDNSIRQMAFYDKAKDKMNASGEILTSLYKDICGEPPLTDQLPPVPDLNDVRRMVSENHDALTEPTVHQVFIEQSVPDYPEDVLAMKKEDREADFRRSDSLFNQREAIQTRIRENESSAVDPLLVQEADMIRFGVADELLHLYSVSAPAINQRLDDNQKALDYLVLIGLIKPEEVPDTSGIGFETISSGQTEKTPKQVHYEVNQKSRSLQKQMQILQEQESLINSVRIKKRKTPPAEWFDLMNKMQRLSEPEIPVQVGNELLTGGDYRNAHIAQTPKERKEQNKLLTGISSARSKEKILQEEIDALLSDDEMDPDKRKKKLEKLETRLESEKLERLMSEVSLQRQYLAYNQSDVVFSERPEELIIREIADSIGQIAVDSYETRNIKSSDDLLYTKGLLVEANQIIENLREGKYSGESANAVIQIYRPGFTIRFEEVLALNSNDGNKTRQGENEPAETDNSDLPRGDHKEEPGDTDNEKENLPEVPGNQQVSKGGGTNSQEVSASDIGQDFRSEETDKPAENNTNGLQNGRAGIGEDQDPVNKTGGELYFRIQMVAYSRPLNDTAFRGISPVVDEQVPGKNIYRYLAGKFYNTNSWRNALPRVQNLGFTDAFPVAYFNRERISLMRAGDLKSLERDLPAEFRILNETPGNLIVRREETRTETKESPVPFLENDNSTFYTIQLGAFGRLLDQTLISGVSADFYHRTGNGYYKYFHGRYTVYDVASREKQRVNRSIPDAFIVAFSGNEKVSRAEADAILQNESVAEVNPVFPGMDDNPEIKFRIQIGAFSNVLSADDLLIYREAFAPYEVGSVNSGNIIIYYVEGFESYEKAGQALKIMVRPVVGDAFVTAWQGDRKIPVKDALIRE